MATQGIASGQEQRDTFGYTRTGLERSVEQPQLRSRIRSIGRSAGGSSERSTHVDMQRVIVCVAGVVGQPEEHVEPSWLVGQVGNGPIEHREGPSVEPGELRRSDEAATCLHRRLVAEGSGCHDIGHRSKEFAEEMPVVGVDLRPQPRSEVEVDGGRVGARHSGHGQGLAERGVVAGEFARCEANRPLDRGGADRMIVDCAAGDRARTALRGAQDGGPARGEMVGQRSDRCGAERVQGDDAEIAADAPGDLFFGVESLRRGFDDLDLSAVGDDAAAPRSGHPVQRGVEAQAGRKAGQHRSQCLLADGTRCCEISARHGGRGQCQHEQHGELGPWDLDACAETIDNGDIVADDHAHLRLGGKGAHGRGQPMRSDPTSGRRR